MSGEHLISECMLAESTTVSGLWWKTPTTLRRESFVSNILCRDHNTELSPLDAEGGRAIETFEGIRAMMQERERIARAHAHAGKIRNGRLKHRWSVKKESINRLLWERWLVKTIVNFAMAAKLRLEEEAAVGQPKRDVVDFVYGRKPLPERVAIAMAATVGSTFDIDRDYSVTFIDGSRPSAPADVFVVGGIVKVAAYHFVVSLIGTALPWEQIAAVLGPATQVVHLGGLNFDVAKRPSHQLKFAPPAGPLPTGFAK